MEHNYLNLYIIGNGFDRYHDLQTQYENFYFYIKKHDEHLLDTLSQYYNVTKPENETKSQSSTVGWLWSKFEQALEYFDEDSLKQWIDEIPYAGSDDSRDQSIDSVKGLVYDRLHPLRDMLQKAFNSWIKSITIDTERKMEFGDKSIFLSFNYTETLQKIYKIPNDRITHIHGKADDKSDLIFGHSWEYKKQLKKEENEEDFPLYPRHIAVKDDVNRFLSTLHKNTEKISSDYYDFFYDSLSLVKNICILGHSLSSVDIFYFQEIAQNIDMKTAKWYISYLTEEDVISINHFIKILQIPHSNVVQFQMYEFDRCEQLIENKILKTPL